MIDTKNKTKIITIIILLTTLTVSVLLAKQIKDLSGSDLLKAIRQRTTPKDAYVNRQIKTKTSAAEPLTTTIEEELTQPPQTKEPQKQSVVPTIQVKEQMEVVGDEILNLIPADSLFCVRINNFDNTLNIVDQFIADLSPVPIGLSMMARMGLAGLLGDAQLRGLDTSADFAAFGTYTQSNLSEPFSDDNFFIAAVLPISDLKQFSTENAGCSSADLNGICNITSKSMKGQQQSFIITQAGNYCLLTNPENYDKLVLAAKSISSKSMAPITTAINTEQTKLAMEQPIWAYGNIELAGKILSPLITAQFEQFKQMMQLQMQRQGQQNAEFAANIMDIYAGILKAFLTQSKYICISTAADSNAIKITETLQALPNTTLADMFTSDTSVIQNNSLMGYLKENSIVNLAFQNTKFNKQITLKAFELVNNILQDANQLFIKTIKDQLDTSDYSAASVKFFSNSTMPFSVKSVTRLTDTEKFKNSLEEYRNNLVSKENFNKFGLDCNFTIQKNASNYKNINIDSIKLTFESTNPNSPTGKIISAVYGEGFDGCNAIVNNLFLVTIGSNCDSDMQELIDIALAGGPKQISSEINTALKLAPQAESADIFVTFNLARYMVMAFSMIQKFDANVKIPQIDVQTKSNLIFTAKASNGGITLDIILPKEHILEIKTVMMQFQQAMMQQQMNVQQQPLPAEESNNQ